MTPSINPSLFISPDEKILVVLKKMDEHKTRLLIVVENQHFKSLVSIGDIQRAIIKGIDLQAPVHTILRDKAKIKIARSGDNFEQIRQTMLAFKTEFMPVLDEHDNIIQLYFWRDIFQEEMHQFRPPVDLPVVIMAGGEGSRLRPLTNIIPKALVPVGDRPILQHIIERFAKTGSSQFYISVNHKHEMIRSYLAGLSDLKAEIKYIQESQPLGTAGSLYLLKGKIRSTFIVSNCDILIDQDFRDIYQYHLDNKNELTLVSALKTYAIPYGTLQTTENGLLTALQEKPDFTLQVNTGVYIVEPHLLDEIPENQHFHITSLIEKVRVRKGRIGVFPISEKSWFDIGQWKDYRQAIDNYMV